MVCSEQKRLDAYFNTSAAEWWMNEKPEAKKYCPFSHKYDFVYIRFSFVSNDSCPPKPVCVICQMKILKREKDEIANQSKVM